MKIHILLAAAVASSALVQAGCNSRSGDDAGTPKVSFVGRRAVDDGNLDLASPTDGHLDIKVFSGGYGHDFFEEAGEEYGEAYGIEVETVGDPHMWEPLRSDFVAGNPPDVTWPGWGMKYWPVSRRCTISRCPKRPSGSRWCVLPRVNSGRP
ncbi:MAG: hypothetical protein IH945_08385 [Armatimonadetes bacterium]|nr:hypothetical protein [Armatimonadota bacterium]